MRKIILAAMEKQGVTQVELSRRTEIAQGHLSLYLRGKKTPNLKTLSNIAKALKLPYQFEWA